jgi:glycosyltransferase involved in cell wall biosynthesis
LSADSQINLEEYTPPLHSSLLRILDQYYKVNYKDTTLQEPFQRFGKKKFANYSQAKKLKILYITFFEYPHTGGLSNYITSIKNGFKKLGHDVDVFAPNQMSLHQLEKSIPRMAEHVRAFMQERYGAVNEKIVKNISFLNVFESFLSEKKLEEYDLFHAQDLFSLFLLGKINQNYKKPLFFTPHGLFTKSRLKFNKMQKGSIEECYFSEIEKQGIKAADEIIIISNSFRQPLIDFGAKEEQMTTVNTGIDFVPIPKKTNKDKLVISCVSRLSPRKGHDIFFEALSLIRDLLSNVEVWIIGDGVMREQLEKQAFELKLNNITFFGKRTDIAEILSSSDIYVLSTINDNFPISVIEAMFSRQAIITTSCGGIPELIEHEKTGILCEPGNVQQLSDAIKLIITNKALRDRISAEAEKYAIRNLTTAVMTAKIEHIYHSYL